MKVTSAAVEVRTTPLAPPAQIYTLYSLIINDVCVRQQISAFSDEDIAAHVRANSHIATRQLRRAA